MKPNESYDQSMKKYRRVYSLDNQRLCFLTVFLNEHRELESVSFDVEAADDYHYKFEADQMPKLCETLSCPNSEADIATAFAKCIKTWTDPIEIASFLRNAGIEFRVFHWY